MFEFIYTFWPHSSQFKVEKIFLFAKQNKKYIQIMEFFIQSFKRDDKYSFKMEDCIGE